MEQPQELRPQPPQTPHRDLPQGSADRLHPVEQRFAGVGRACRRLDRLHQDVAQVAVARLGDPPTPDPVRGGVFRGGQPRELHERRGAGNRLNSITSAITRIAARGETPEGPQAASPAPGTGPSPPTRRSVPPPACSRSSSRAASVQVVIQHRPVQGESSRLPHPAPVRRGPASHAGRLAVCPWVSSQWEMMCLNRRTSLAMSSRHRISPRTVFLLAGDPDERQRARPKRQGQLPGIPRVGLDPVPGRRGIRDGATTRQSIPLLQRARANPYPQGPAS